MDNIKMPKKYKYCFYYNGIETQLLTDPKGWDEKALAFQRNDNLSVVTTFSVPLSFGRDGRKFLRNIFDSKGTLKTDIIFRIYKRNNDWSYSLFYLARVNTAEYSDDFKTITMSLEDVGLQALIDRYIDQVYDIDYDIPKDRLIYTGVNKISKNILQLNAKTGLEVIYEGSSKGYHELPASRSTREYNASLSFVNDDGTPFTRMMFKCLQATTVSLELNINFRINRDISFIDSDERLLLIKYSGDIQNHDNREAVLEIIPRAQGGGPGSGLTKTDFFYDEPFLLDVSLEPNEYLILVYRAEVISAGRTYSIDYELSSETNINIISNTKSPLQSYEMNMITPKDLLTKLLYRITDTIESDNYFTLDYGVDFINFHALLSSSDGMRNLPNGKINASLKDLLKWLRCWGYTYQIEGTKIKILKVDDLFKDEINKEIKVFNEVELKADTTHTYTSLSVGYKTTTQDKLNGIYEFNCQNEFENKIYIDENKLNLVSPYIGSMYDIEEYLIKVQDNPTTNDYNDNKIFVFACEFILGGADGNKYKLDKRTDSSFISTGIYDAPTAFNIPLSPMRMLLSNKKYISISLWKTLTEWVFTSSDVNADVITKMRYETQAIDESSNVPIDVPLFLPLKLTFNTASLFKDMNTFSLNNISKYFQLSHKNGIFSGYIDDVNMNIGDNRQESYSLLVKEIKEYK